MKLFILDTNAFLRYILNDIAKQADEVEAVFTLVKRLQAQVTIPLEVFLEAAYVLTRVYGYTRVMIQKSCREFFSIPGLDIPDRFMLEKAYTLWVEHRGVSLSDTVLLQMAKTSGKELLTFDRKLKLLAEKMKKDGD